MKVERRRSIQARIFALLARRKVGQTICPSEVLPPRSKQVAARMDEVREVARALARRRKIEIVQRGRALSIDVAEWKGPIRLRLPKSAVPFEYRGIDFRREPERYRVARGEQGVLSVEPYKSELLPHWRFKTPEIAARSVRALLREFRRYRDTEDFVGMDMARKFLQMGFTRARRYANHRSGRKYVGSVPIDMRGRSGAHGRIVAVATPDPEKARSAEIFRAALKRVEGDREYAEARTEWKKRFG